jgi:hypothetical protein
MAENVWIKGVYCCGSLQYIMPHCEQYGLCAGIWTIFTNSISRLFGVMVSEQCTLEWRVFLYDTHVKYASARKFYVNITQQTDKSQFGE